MHNILLLREKKAGHINQVEGLATMLNEMAPCAIARIDVRPIWWAHVAIRNLYLRMVDLKDREAIAHAVYALYGINLAALDPPSLAIGSGRPTTALLIWIGAYFGCKTAFSGHASGPLRDRIDLQLVNSPRGIDSGKCAVAPAPGKIDADDYPPPKPIDSIADLRGARLSLIVGGNSHSHTFSARDWQRMIALMRETKAKYGVRWSATNSRRSPPDLAPQLEALVSEGILETFVDFAKAGLSSAKDVFGGDLLLVTEDSLSMVSEGFAAGRPVIALRPARAKKSEFTETIAYQCGQGWLCSLPLATLDAALLADAALALAPPRLSAKALIKPRLAALLPA